MYNWYICLLFTIFQNIHSTKSLDPKSFVNIPHLHTTNYGIADRGSL